MKIAMVSNYFNHHQKPLCDKLYELCDGEFYFIATSEMTDERKNMGWKLEYTPKYVVDASVDIKERKKSIKIIDDADVVIWGDAPKTYLQHRIRKSAVIFRCSERIFKKGYSLNEYIPRVIKHLLINWKSRRQYLLCASAYAADDYESLGLYKNHAFKWGYFPKTLMYDSIDDIIKKKKNFSILWVSRLIPLKHPEAPLYVAKKLKEENIKFSLDIVGTGEMKTSIENTIEKEKLTNEVFLHGAMSPEEVRKIMEKSSIFLFTSDYNEGWGAVLNEAMNSGCAVIANNQIGSVPYLISNRENGLIYQNGDQDELYYLTKKLLLSNTLCRKLGRNAYLTLQNVWNAENAAKQFVLLANQVKKGLKIEVNETGPCSIAKRIYDGRKK